MKLSKIRLAPIPAAGKAKKAGRATGVSFADHLKPSDGQAPAVERTSGNATISPVGPVLAAQEAAPAGDDQGRRHMHRHGEDILDRLDEIRHDILIGAVPKERLANLAQLLRARRQSVDDEKLIQIIDEIELRAEVEIAKLTRKI